MRGTSRMHARSAAVVSAMILLALPDALLMRLPSSVSEWYFLYETPLESHISDVREFVSTREWEVAYDSETHGFLDQREPGDLSTVGSMSIRAQVGSYWGIPFLTYVTVFWGFNGDGKLIDIWVWKTRDVL